MRVKAVGVACFSICVLATGLAPAADRDLRLIDASKRGDAPAVKALMAAGVDANASAADGMTALHWAASQGDLALATALLRKGANVNAVTDLGITPLWIAARNANTAMAARLLDAGAYPNIAPPTGQTPLMIAAEQGDATAVNAMLVHHADPNARENAHGQTALMWAAAERHPDVVRLLLAAGADVTARSKSYTQREQICCQLYGGDEAPALVPKGGYTPLLFAAQSGDAESARLLIGAHANVNDAAPDGASALVVAAHLGNAAVAGVLLDAGADPNTAGAGYTALHVAATRGDVATVQALLAHHADINARQQQGSPTLRVNSGHSLDFRMAGATPYILAARAGYFDVMRVLADKGADTKLTLNDGRTALMVLAGEKTQEGPRLSEAQSVETIKLAIELGTPVNQAGPNGDTALHVAATRRRDEVVQVLADNGAALNARNRDGETPLTAALKPPSKQKGSGVSDDYNYLLKHTSTAALLRKLGAKT